MVAGGSATQAAMLPEIKEVTVEMIRNVMYDAHVPLDAPLAAKQSHGGGGVNGGGSDSDDDSGADDDGDDDGNYTMANDLYTGAVGRNNNQGVYGDDNIDYGKANTLPRNALKANGSSTSGGGSGAAGVGAPGSNNIMYELAGTNSSTVAATTRGPTPSSSIVYLIPMVTAGDGEGAGTYMNATVSDSGSFSRTPAGTYMSIEETQYDFGRGGSSRSVRSVTGVGSTAAASADGQTGSNNHYDAWGPKPTANKSNAAGNTIAAGNTVAAATAAAAAAPSKRSQRKKVRKAKRAGAQRAGQPQVGTAAPAPAPTAGAVAGIDAEALYRPMYELHTPASGGAETGAARNNIYNAGVPPPKRPQGAQQQTQQTPPADAEEKNEIIYATPTDNEHNDGGGVASASPAAAVVPSAGVKIVQVYGDANGGHSDGAADDDDDDDNDGGEGGRGHERRGGGAVLAPADAGGNAEPLYRPVYELHNPAEGAGKESTSSV